MAKNDYRGVIEAVHYAPDGRVDWARVFLKRGATWSDRIILRRDALIEELKRGRKIGVGKRREGLAGTFDVSSQPLRLVGKEGSEVLVISSDRAEVDTLEGIPVI